MKANLKGSEGELMAGMTLEELQANKPTADDEVYDEQRAAAAVLLALSRRAGQRDHVAAACPRGRNSRAGMGTTPIVDRPI